MSWLVVLSLVFCASVQVQSSSESDQHKAAEYAEWFEKRLRAADLPASQPPADAPLSQTSARVDFECEALENTPPPTSVDNLSPKYVNVIAALGDSVTAAFGAGSSIIFDTREFRGLSWSIGGDKTLTEVQTLANAMRLFNTTLYGYSTGTGTSNAELNVAVSGARTRDMPVQAENLVKKMQEKGITDEDWKVITIWIGGNDICDIRAGASPEELASQYTENVRVALDYLRDNVKNAFVNLVYMIDIAKLHEVKGITCSIVHEFSCNSIQKEETRELASKTSNLYNTRLRELIDNGNRYTSTDFTVVIQPFFSETPVPKLPDGNADKSYFAPDCFHFSQKGHGIGGTYLWNNMFEPVENKTIAVDWNNQQTFVCPKDYPYFRTYKNSEKALLKTNVKQEQGSFHLAAIMLCTGVGVIVVSLATIVISIGIVRFRQRRREREYRLPKRRPPSEKMHLLNLKN